MKKENWLPAFATNNIPVVIASDNYCAPYAGVLLRSLLDYASNGNNYDVIIIERDISDDNKRILSNLVAQQENVSLRFYNPNSFLSGTDVSSLGSKQYPLEVYYRIFAAYMFECYERLITIDVDMLLKRDIAQVFRTDLEGACIGAALDIMWQGYYKSDYVFAANHMSAHEYQRQILNMKNPMGYINAGLVLYDCEKYRKELDWETLISVANNKPFLYAEESVLNVLMEGKIKYLDLSWNLRLPINARSQYAINSAPAESVQAYRKALEAPALLHWAGMPKPWVCPDVQYSEMWWETAMRTPFVGHIIARMFDALQTRRDYYQNKYGQEVAVWEPVPNVTREM